MRETFTSGSVGRAPGNRCLYPEPDRLQPTLLRRCGFQWQVSAGVRLLQIRSAVSLGLSRGTRSEKDIPMWPKPIRLVVTLALVLLTVPLAVEAQPPTKVHRV